MSSVNTVRSPDQFCRIVGQNSVRFVDIAHASAFLKTDVRTLLSGNYSGPVSIGDHQIYKADDHSWLNSPETTDPEQAAV